MQGWNIVGRYTDMFERPTVLKWILAGSAAGAATTIIGEGGVWVGGGGGGCVCVCMVGVDRHLSCIDILLTYSNDSVKRLH